MRLSFFVLSLITLTGLTLPVSSSSKVLFPTPLGPTMQTGEGEVELVLQASAYQAGGATRLQLQQRGAPPRPHRWDTVRPATCTLTPRLHVNAKVHIFEESLLGVVAKVNTCTHTHTPQISVRTTALMLAALM